MYDSQARLTEHLSERYRLERELGSGGMATVYLAQDLKHGRSVALKVLRPELAVAIGSERFLSEIRLTAKLQHPHLLPLFDSGEAGGLLYYVMPYVEGESLRQKLDRERQLPVDEAVRIAVAVASALDYAHRKQVVHRDLKPENILLQDGQPFVSDFGIALAISMAGGERLTGTGVSIGTPQYMSPEQATGDALLDPRSDIYALGAVTYEMLAGAPPHSGTTVQAVIAKVLTEEPRRLKAERPSVPEHVEAAVLRALAKLPADRFSTAAAFAETLSGARAAAPPVAVFQGAGAAIRHHRWALVVAGVLALAAVAGVLSQVWWRPNDSPVIRFTQMLPEGVSFASRFYSLLAIAPDGSSIVFAGSDRLYRRALGEMEPVGIRGTEGSPAAPFFSPDGQSVGYWDVATGQLLRINVAGGAPVPLTRVTAPYGMNWETDGTIVYGQDDGVWRVSANGGAPEQIVRIEPSELLYGPRMMPGGKAVLFSLTTRESMIGQSTGWDSARIMIQSMDTGDREVIGRGGDARFLPTGHLLFTRNTDLFAAEFDVAKSEVRGAPVPLVAGVSRGIRGSGGQGGAANYDVSRSGTLIYLPQPASAAVQRRLLAVDFEGNAEPLIVDQRNYWRPRISPDGTRIAVEVQQQDQSVHLWIVNLKNQTSTPLSVDPASGYAAWTPDGESVVYRRRTPNLIIQAADGSRAAESLLGNQATGRVMDVSRTGIVAFAAGSPQDDIRIVHLGGSAASDFLATPAREHMARFSPDSRWLAYTSNESGRNEVYVRPFPRTEGVARLVSIGGGSGPVWAPDGSTLFYRGESGDIMAVPTSFRDGFSAGRPVRRFRFEGVYRMSGTATAYDIHPDGKRFIMVSEPEGQDDSQAAQQVHVVINWIEELKRLAAPSR